MADQVETAVAAENAALHEQAEQAAPVGEQSDTKVDDATTGKDKSSTSPDAATKDTSMISYIGLFRYADTLDKFLIFGGSLSGVAYGVI